MSTRRTKAELEAENHILRRSNAADGFASVLRTLIKWGSFVCIAYFAKEAIKALAGQTTFSQFIIDVPTLESLVDWKEYVLLAFGTLGPAYGYYQRRLKINTISQLHGRIETLETRLDPNRSSSTLTRTGETRPEDRT